MDLKEIYDTRIPPYVRRPKQTEAAETALGVETPGDSQKAITAFTRQVQLIRNGEWKVDHNDELGAVVITGGHFDPDFRVRAFKLYIDSQTFFTDWVYDTPWSSKVIDSWATGIVHPGHITRVWTGDPSMAELIKISLFG